MSYASPSLTIEPTDQSEAQHLLQHLRAIIEGSQDAILTKDLKGIITSWNPGAEALFGYCAEEVLGKPINLLIPSDRQDEEPQILARIRRGERIEHYETVRRSKDGQSLDVSLTVSPLRRADGTIYGASKIARDITRQKRDQKQQELLLCEMQHRIKNVFSLASGLVRLCSKSCSSQGELATVLDAKLSALARAHSLVAPSSLPGSELLDQMPTLNALLRALADPFVSGDGSRLRLTGDSLPLSMQTLTPLALTFGELMTNASKYGAFRSHEGWVEVSCHRQGSNLTIDWLEHSKCDQPAQAPDDGFGSRLMRSLVEEQLNGTIDCHNSPTGLHVAMTIAI